MKQKFLDFYFLTLSFFLLFGQTKTAFAASAAERYSSSLRNTAVGAGLADPGNVRGRSFEYIVGQYVNAILDLLGVLFLVLIIYGGILWMTAAGNEQKVEKAKKIIISSVIGLGVILLSRAITLFLLDVIEPALT